MRGEALIRLTEEEYKNLIARRSPTLDEIGAGERKKVPSKPDCPFEEVEQRTLAQFLDFKGFLWTHPPNEGKRNLVAGSRLKQAGMSKGCPDVLIFDPPTGYVGCAIELKRKQGGKLSKAQGDWLINLNKCGWLVTVAKGADEAIKFIREAYGI